MHSVKLAQISDIHIGGDYEGKFPVWDNFMKLIKAVEPGRYLIITGDLADCDYEKNYTEMKQILDDNFGGNYSVLPGNHDDVDMLNKIFDGHTESFELNDLRVSLLPTVATPIIDVNTGMKTVEGNIDPRVYAPACILKDSLVFTHYPVLDSEHKFMNKFALNQGAKDFIVKKMIEKDCRYLFCGHFHDMATIMYTQNLVQYRPAGLPKFGTIMDVQLTQYMCPASQCQIGVYFDDFVSTSIEPNGYDIDVGIDDGKIIVVNVKPMVEVEE